MQTFFPDSTFGSELAFQVTPETFKAVNVVTVSNTTALAMVDKAMNVTFGCDAGIAAPGIGINHRTFFDLWTVLAYIRGRKYAPDLNLTSCSKTGGSGQHPEFDYQDHCHEKEEK